MQRLSVSSLILLLLPCMAMATPVPDTGQTKCYDNTQEITCPIPGEDFYGQDAQYITNPHSYTKLDTNGNDLPDNAPWPWAMVRDNVTGLIWEVKTDDGSIHDKDNAYTWAEAMEFGTTLNSQTFGGFADWRLPTIKELSGLADISIPEPGPTINTDYFPYTLSSNYWSSTDSAASVESETWYVQFYAGVVNDSSVSSNFRVMAVRGAQSGASGNYVDNSNDTISDTDTGFMWQKDTALGTYTWKQALAYCENLTLAEYDDWRLPNRKELQTLVDYSRSEPSIDTVYFPSTESGHYWTSTTKAGYLSEAWSFLFRYGSTGSWVKSSAYNYLRCVRGAALVDSDADGISEDGDNCPYNYNPLQLDTYPTGGNGCGDACECHADCNDDQKVNLADLVTMKGQFFWKCSEHPSSLCEADCNYDGNVNLSDLVMMKSEFNRTDCPECP